MKISTKGRYALRLMLYLAQHDSGEYIALKDISIKQDISMKYLEQIVMLLTKAGFLKSVRGPQGGYRLAKSAAAYTVGDILRLTEGSLAPVACLADDPNQCPRMEQCPTLPFWQGLYQVISVYVDRFTLQDLVDQARAQQGWDFSI